MRDDIAAGHAGERAHVDEVVGAADRVFVMLHHQHGVAQALQTLQCAQQSFVIALVQANRRLVQHIQHAGEAGADLAGEADALALAAGKCCRAARQGEVVQPHIHEKLQTLVDFPQNPPGDFQPLRRQRCRHTVEPFARAGDGEFRDFGQIMPRDFHRQRLGLQPRAVAGAAGAFGVVAGEFLARPGGIGFTQPALKVFNHTLERFFYRVGARGILVGKLHLHLAGAV